MLTARILPLHDTKGFSVTCSLWPLFIYQILGGALRLVGGTVRKVYVGLSKFFMATLYNLIESRVLSGKPSQMADYISTGKPLKAEPNRCLISKLFHVRLH